MNKFKYLISDYGFAVKIVDESQRNPQIEGRIEFETATTFVTVSCDQWVISVSFGRVKDDKYRFFLYPEIVHEYFVLSEADKNKSLSPPWISFSHMVAEHCLAKSETPEFNK